MSSGFFATIFRFLIFFVNFAFVVLGGVTFGYGLNLHNVAVKSSEVAEPDATPIALMILGGLVFLVAFFGCCGAFKESSCMLRTYSILVLILLVLQLYLAYRVYEKPDVLKNAFETNLHKMVNDYDHNNSSRKFLDEVQSGSLCCGADGPEDYTKAQISIPKSCCKDPQPNCDINKAYSHGCVATLIETFNDNLSILKHVGIFVVAFQALAILISCCLANNIRRAYDVV